MLNIGIDLCYIRSFESTELYSTETDMGTKYGISFTAVKIELR